jgi:hypothetical protein
MIAQRRAYETGVAFVIDTGNPLVWQALSEAGWNCVPVRDTDDPAAVWASVAAFGTDPFGAGPFGAGPFGTGPFGSDPARERS